VFLRAAPAHPGRRVGVVGLGAGTTAAYAGPKESWTFYEIDPLVERIARDTAYFTYLADARTPPRVVLGDARLSLAEDSSARLDLLVVDAFSSDAPPAHLLTREAVRLYFGRLAPGGLLLLDLSNRYLDFVPVVAALAADAGLVARVRDHDPTPAEARLGDAGSVWAVLARKGGDLGRIAQDPRWKPPAGAAGALWTDDFSNVVRRLR
jgi:spermidine synthase